MDSHNTSLQIRDMDEKMKDGVAMAAYKCIKRRMVISVIYPNYNTIYNKRRRREEKRRKTKRGERERDPPWLLQRLGIISIILPSLSWDVRTS